LGGERAQELINPSRHDSGNNCSALRGGKRKMKKTRNRKPKRKKGEFRVGSKKRSTSDYIKGVAVGKNETCEVGK